MFIFRKYGGIGGVKVVGVSAASWRSSAGTEKLRRISYHSVSEKVPLEVPRPVTLKKKSVTFTYIHAANSM